MNAHRIAIRLSAAFATALTCACASPMSSFYTLDSTATPDGGPPTQYAVVIGTVTIPASVSHPQFTLQLSANQVEINEYHRWAAPLDEAIGRVVARDLAALLGTPNVASGSVGNFTPAYRVTIDVQRFQSTLGSSALVDALWTVSKTGGGPPRSGRSIEQEAVSGPAYDALAAAHSRALAKLSADIATAIRAEASGS
ncbi:MAG: membrane integrity-associated transporter subunit PqiC [Myxococcota bacterium]